jgi:hypothetical protein
MIVLPGLEVFQKENHTVTFIHCISKEFEDLLKEQLPIICHGQFKSDMNINRYSYLNTIKEFWERYKTKSDDIKVGMVGELLVHVLINAYHRDFKTMSPFFNMEERSIRKGFDLVLFKNNSIWLAEIKSGRLHKNKNADETKNDLLNLAKRDLQKRVEEGAFSIWENAINAATITMGQNKKISETMIQNLYKLCDEISMGLSQSNRSNALLASTIFEISGSKISEQKTKEFLEQIESEKIFNNVFVMAMQQKTLDSFESFFQKEAENGK